MRGTCCVGSGALRPHIVVDTVLFYGVMLLDRGQKNHHRHPRPPSHPYDYNYAEIVVFENRFFCFRWVSAFGDECKRKIRASRVGVSDDD